MKKIKEKLREHNIRFWHIFLAVSTGALLFWLGHEVGVAIGNLWNNWRGV